MLDIKYAADRCLRFLAENGYDSVACAKVPIMSKVMLAWVNEENDDITTLKIIENLNILTGEKLKKGN